ncbi:MAG: DNA repair protein RadA [Christensenellales bacterium]
MAKTKGMFECCECGYESTKWMGKCPACGEWNTMSEQLRYKDASSSEPKAVPRATLIKELPGTDQPRFQSGIEELDRVLGGGIVYGSTVLLGGDPGIGKSTLLLQACDRVARSGGRVLYLSAEESALQIKLRANRLGVGDDVFVLAYNDLDAIVEAIRTMKPQMLVADSIQTVYRSLLPSTPGSITQIKESASLLGQIAREENIAVFLVGHVTKEGAIAGPRILEHMVDTVLYFEGERQHSFRILRTVKNRFGSTNEIGIFEMEQDGMRQVADASALLLQNYGENPPAGSAVVCTMEGTRPVLAEIQTLLCNTPFGTPRRMATGMDYNRTVLMLAVLEKKAGLRLFDQDAYINVVGGLKISEPAADLPLCLSAVSAYKGVPLRKHCVAMGEVGLTGEIRSVSRMEQRLFECSRMGFTRCILPADHLKVLKNSYDMEIVGVKTINQAIEEAIL